MKRKRVFNTNVQILFTIVLVVILCIAIVFLMFQKMLKQNIQQKAFEELNYSVSERAGNICHAMDIQFASLDGMAEYLGSLNEFEFIEQKDMLRSFLSTITTDFIAYSDMNGNVLGKVGTSADLLESNIANQEYFQRAVSRESAHLIQYQKNDSRYAGIIMIVPVKNGSNTIGMFLSYMNHESFERVLWNGSALEKEIYLLDADGSLIAKSANNQDFQYGDIIFDYFSFQSEKDRDLKAELASGFSGNFTVSKPEFRYSGYAALGINNWSIVCMMDSDAAYEICAPILHNVRIALNILSTIFVLCALALVTTFIIFDIKNRKKTSELQEFSVKMKRFLSQSGNLSFDFDVKSLTLTASDALNEYIEDSLPRDWFSTMSRRVQLHPEFNYKAIAEAYKDLLVSDDYREIVSCLKISSKGLRWIKISIAAIRTEGGHTVGVYGIVTDITESYIDSHVVQEERNTVLSAVFSFVLMTVSGNLTKNTYSLVNYKPLENDGFPWNGDFDSLIEHVSTAVPQSHRQKFIDSFSRENLLVAYEKGTDVVELEHPIASPKAGRVLWVISKIYFLKEPAGEDVRTMTVVIDITQQKEHSMFLQRNLDLTIENMPGFACKWLFEENDIILLDANSSFYRFMKAPEDLAKNHSIIYGFSEQEKADVLAIFFAQEREKKDIHYSGHGFKHNGEEIWMNVSGTYFGTLDGKSVYYCIISDITSAVELRERAIMDKEAFEIAARMSPHVVMKYDVKDRKLHVLSGNPQAHRITLLDGHAPEYAIEMGIVQISSETSYYNAFIEIEHGSKEGNILFRAENVNQLCWYTGHYQTVFDRTGNPLTAIFLLRDNTEPDKYGSATMVATHSWNNNRKSKLLIINLSTDIIEYETDSEDIFILDEGISTFSEAKEYFIRERIVSQAYSEEAEKFLDNARLIDLYQAGNQECCFSYIGRTRYGDNRKVRVRVLLQETQFDHCVKACIIFEDAKESNYPSAKLIESTVQNNRSNNKVEIRTFGYFDVFVNGQPISFVHDKSKEMLAVLVDRRGGYISTSELIGYLWEDEPSNKTTQSRCRQVASRLKKILEDNGIDDIIETVNGKRRIIPEKVDCDYLNYLKDKYTYQHLYNGSYMLNYSWGEATLADLENSKSFY